MPKGYYERKPRQPLPQRLCSIEGCNKKHESRGWCKMHYKRWMRHGDPLIKLQGNTLQFVKSSLANRDRSECWEWPFTRNPHGYGFVWFENRMVQVHHVALVLDGKPQPEPPNHWALHSCDNPPCFNPQHLRWGNRLDNTADMITRDRQTKGTRNPQAKLTEVEVLTIRDDVRPQRSIARDFGICQQTVSLIKRRELWGHL